MFSFVVSTNVLICWELKFSPIQKTLLKYALHPVCTLFLVILQSLYTVISSIVIWKKEEERNNRSSTLPPHIPLTISKYIDIVFLCMHDQLVCSFSSVNECDLFLHVKSFNVLIVS